MAVRRAEVEYVGDASSVVRASRQAAAAGEVVATAAQKAGKAIQEQAALASKAAEEQARAAGASAKQQAAAFASAADAATAAGIKQRAALEDTAAATARTGKRMSAMGRDFALGAFVAVAATADMALKIEHAAGRIAASSGTSVEAAKRIESAFQTTAGSAIWNAAQLGEAYAKVAGELGTVEGHALKQSEAMKVMTAAQNLAEASGGELDSTTEALGKTMLVYHLGSTKAAEASDVLFAASKKAGVGVTETAVAIDKIKGRLGVLAPSLKESGGLMSDFARHGIQGRESLAALNGAFNTLISGGKKVEARLKELGVHVFDSQGKFVGLKNVIAQLGPALAKYDQQSQLMAARDLFGASANKKLLDIIHEGPAAFQAATDAVAKHGSAAQAAERHSETFAGQLEKLKVAIEDEGGVIGEALLPELKALVTATEESAKWLGKHETAAKALGGVITLVLGGALTVFAYTKAVAFIGATKDMITAVGALAAKMTGAAGTVGTADAAIVTANESAGASFAALGAVAGPIALATAALYGFNKAEEAAREHAGGLGEVLDKILNATTGALGSAEENFTTGKMLAQALSGGKNASGSASGSLGGSNPLTSGGGMPGGLGPKFLNTGRNQMTLEAAKKYGVAPGVLWGVYGNETSYGTNIATSSAGAMGAFQFIPSTAKEYGYPMTNTPNAAQFQKQAEAAARYMSVLIKQYHGNVSAALEAYSGNTPGYAKKALSNQYQYGTGHLPGIETLTAKHAKAKAEGYYAPLDNPKITREDMGLDFLAHPGERVKAIGAGVIDKIIKDWYKGQPLIEERLTSGAHKGQYVYYAEQINAAVREGQHVRAGSTIGTVARSGTGLEFGFGAGGGMTLAQARKEFQDHAGNDPTRASKAYASFLKGVGKTGSQIAAATQEFADEIKRQEHLHLTAAQQLSVNRLARGAAGAHSQVERWKGAASEAGETLAAYQPRFALKRKPLSTEQGAHEQTLNDWQTIETAKAQKKYYKQAVHELQKEVNELGKLRDSYLKFARHQPPGSGAKKEALDKAAKFEGKIGAAKAEAKALKGTIFSTETAIMEGEATLAALPGEVAAANAEATAQAQGASMSAYQAANSKIDLEERAGLLTPEQAKAGKEANANKALAGGYGALSEEGVLQAKGDLREFSKALEAGTAAVENHTSALTEATKALNEFTNAGNNIARIEAGSSAKSLADVISGRIAGVNYHGRAMTPGAGTAARY